MRTFSSPSVISNSAMPDSCTKSIKVLIFRMSILLFSCVCQAVAGKSGGVFDTLTRGLQAACRCWIGKEVWGVGWGKRLFCEVHDGCADGKFVALAAQTANDTDSLV